MLVVEPNAAPRREERIQLNERFLSKRVDVAVASCSSVSSTSLALHKNRFALLIFSFFAYQCLFLELLEEIPPLS